MRAPYSKDVVTMLASIQGLGSNNASYRSAQTDPGGTRPKCISPHSEIGRDLSNHFTETPPTPKAEIPPAYLGSSS